MANDLGQMVTARVVMKMFDFLRAGYPFLFRANAIHKDMPAKLGDTVTVSYPTGGAVQDFPGTSKDVGMVSIPVKLDKWRVTRFTLTPREIASLHEGRDSIVDKLAVHHVRALMADAMTSIRTAITAANVTTASTEVVANFGYDRLLEIRKTLNVSKTSLDRYVILGPSLFAALVKDPVITNKQTNLDNINTIGTARVEKVAGFDIYEDAYWDESAKLMGLAAGAEAVAIATAVPDMSLGGAIKSHVQRGVIKDSESDFQLMLDEWDDPDNGYTVRIGFLSGVGVNDKEKTHGVRLVTA